MAPAADLVPRVGQDRTKHRHSVPYTPGGPGQVHYQSTPGDPGDTTRENRGRHFVASRDPDRLGDAGDLPVDHSPGHLGGEVLRGEPGAAGRDDDVVPAL